MTVTLWELGRRRAADAAERTGCSSAADRARLLGGGRSPPHGPAVVARTAPRARPPPDRVSPVRARPRRRSGRRPRRFASRSARSNEPLGARVTFVGRRRRHRCGAARRPDAADAVLIDLELDLDPAPSSRLSFSFDVLAFEQVPATRTSPSLAPAVGCQRRVPPRAERPHTRSRSSCACSSVPLLVVDWLVRRLATAGPGRKWTMVVRATGILGGRRRQIRSTVRRPRAARCFASCSPARRGRSRRRRQRCSCSASSAIGRPIRDAREFAVLAGQGIVEPELTDTACSRATPPRSRASTGSCRSAC